jgi:hypothetical protein
MFGAAGDNKSGRSPSRRGPVREGEMSPLGGCDARGGPPPRTRDQVGRGWRAAGGPPRAIVLDGPDLRHRASGQSLTTPQAKTEHRAPAAAGQRMRRNDAARRGWVVFLE